MENCSSYLTFKTDRCNGYYRFFFSRNEQWASLVVDSGTGVSASSPGQLRQLNTDTGLYVGKYTQINIIYTITDRVVNWT